MIETINLQQPPANVLLSALNKKDYQRIQLRLEPVDLIFGEALFNPGDKMRYVYFPQSGVVSVLAIEKDATLEIGLVGNEGIVGLPVFLEVQTSRSLVIVQGDGSALRMKAADFLKECKQSLMLSRLLHRYTHYWVMQISQAVVCNRRHLIESRLACILLMMHDRMPSNQFKLKQEFLSKILGVRREAVTLAAGNLQKKQLISYSRGNLSIINREGLEADCCRCYEIVNGEFQEFLAAQKQLN
jgi:CRP-like cAMP-binding protein